MSGGKLIKQMKVLAVPVLGLLALALFVPPIRNFLFGTVAMKGDQYLGGVGGLGAASQAGTGSAIRS